MKTDDERNNFNFSANRKHWNPREISEIQSGKPRNKTPEVLFLQPIRYHVTDSLQGCMSITWDVWPLVPLLIRCVVCLQFTPTVFSYDWATFLKSASSLDFEQWKKKKSEIEEKSSSTVGLFAILDNVSSSRSWSPGNWRLVHNQSRSVQTFRSFNQLISSHLKDLILDDIQTINFLPSCLYYYMVLSRSRSPKRRH